MSPAPARRNLLHQPSSALIRGRKQIWRGLAIHCTPSMLLASEWRGYSPPSEKHHSDQSAFARMPILNPPEPVLAIARRLEEGSYEAWCVGGAVRDALLGHPHLDWDLATSATPEQVRAIFGRRRTIPVGIQFGTVGVLDDIGTLHEVTTFRRDVKTDGRHAEVEFGATLDEDLARRDFTINAIAYSPSRG